MLIHYLLSSSPAVEKSLLIFKNYFSFLIKTTLVFSLFEASVFCSFSLLLAYYVGHLVGPFICQLISSVLRHFLELFPPFHFSFTHFPRVQLSVCPPVILFSCYFPPISLFALLSVRFSFNLIFWIFTEFKKILKLSFLYYSKIFFWIFYFQGYESFLLSLWC